MDKGLAQKIGAKEAVKFVSVGIGVAYIIMALLAGPLFFLETGSFNLNLICAVIIMYSCGYFYGRRAGIAILIKNRNYFWVGFLYALLTLLTATFLASWIGFFKEGIKNIGTNDNPFEDYIERPLVLITLVGFLPVIGIGFWFGVSILNRGKKFAQNISTINN